MKTVKILGTGCPKCKILEANVIQALKELGEEMVCEKITDMEQIMKYNILGMPALVVDEKVLFSGRGMGVGDLVKLLSKKNQFDDVPV